MDKQYGEAALADGRGARSLGRKTSKEKRGRKEMEGGDKDEQSKRVGERDGEEWSAGVK